MVAYFQLQPAEAELQQLAEQYWQTTGEKEHELEKQPSKPAKRSAMAKPPWRISKRSCAGSRSARAIPDREQQREDPAGAGHRRRARCDDGNGGEGLLELHGVDLPVASAILAAIYPERYTVLDFRALEALGHARHDVHFYEEYLAFCKRLAESNIVSPQSELPAPTSLRTLDRALFEWTRSHTG